MNPRNTLRFLFAQSRGRDDLGEVLGIEPVPLPPYTLDFNPIEFLWKNVKKVVSTTPVMSEWHLRGIIEKTFLDTSAFNSRAMV